MSRHVLSILLNISGIVFTQKSRGLRPDSEEKAVEDDVSGDMARKKVFRVVWGVFYTRK